ncbi:MAG: hypothetical protein KBS68_00385 [Clostridiales bacterium]|nr:hypothetical protein [Candidatus Crickella merdequi]
MSRRKKIIIVICSIPAILLILYLGALAYMNTIVIEEQHISQMPDSFYGKAYEQGHLEVVEYDTTINGKSVTKNATVYLPYGYKGGADKYDVLYLMHGRGGSYRTWLGKPGSERPFKNILDNMIENRVIRPIIVVAPELSYDYGEDDDIMDGTAGEIAEDLIPLIDRRYRTYGDRNHRGMAGFSMGGSLTWHMLKDHTDCFYYYLPMSMALYYDSNGYSKTKSIRSAASIIHGIRKSGYNASDFKVYTATGENDHKALAAYMQVEDLIHHKSLFRYADDDFSEGNIMFKVWPVKWHRYTESFPYLYDGLGYMFN